MKISYYLARRIIFTVIVSVSLIAFGAAMAAMAALDRYSFIIKELEALDTSSTFAELEVSKKRYLVREHEGIIGVFSLNGELEYTVEIYVKTLPEKDRQLLKSGIYAQNREELLEILGDYNA